MNLSLLSTECSGRINCIYLLLYVSDILQAAEIANDTGDRAACYHLARQFENNNDFKQAIHFFTRAMAYGNAIRICKVMLPDFFVLFLLESWKRPLAYLETSLKDRSIMRARYYY